LNWRAIGIGAFAGLVLVALQVGIAFVAPLERYPELIKYVITANQLLSIACYAVAGAVAGNIARRNGALHGLFAGVVTSIAGRVFGTTLSYLRYGIEAVQAMLAEPGTQVVYFVIGVTIATVAGGIAARIALRRPAS
jgi:hypothetical protein